jgi:quinol-cytochrome oxidoreductase complex cytochrome b subunit
MGGLDVSKLINFFPSFGIKDLVAFLVTMLFLGIVLALHPNVFGHPDNDTAADMLVTPSHIVPE